MFDIIKDIITIISVFGMIIYLNYIIFEILIVNFVNFLIKHGNENFNKKLTNIITRGI